MGSSDVKSASSSHSPATTLATSTLSIVLGALPFFLVGALAVFIRPELGFSETALGALATVYYLASAITTVPAGRLAERLGGPTAMAVGAALALASGLGIATVVNSWSTLAAMLAIAGIGNGIAFPASNLALTRGVPIRRQGVAFAIKQSAGPYATILAGLAVPLVALTIGWRWAFAAMAMAALPIISRWRHDDPISPPPRLTPARVPRGPLWGLAAAAFFGVNATAALGAFYVESAVARGLNPARAGIFLAVGSAIGIVLRVIWGWISDRNHAVHFVLLATLLLSGALGFVALGRVTGAVPILVVTIWLFSTGWAWPSLLGFAVVLRVPDAPGVASGILGAGQFGGGILGPLVFGLLAEHSGYGVAWTYAAAMTVAASVAVAVGGHALRRAALLERSAR